MKNMNVVSFALAGLLSAGYVFGGTMVRIEGTSHDGTLRASCLEYGGAYARCDVTRGFPDPTPSRAVGWASARPGVLEADIWSPPRGPGWTWNYDVEASADFFDTLSFTAPSPIWGVSVDWATNAFGSSLVVYLDAYPRGLVMPGSVIDIGARLYATSGPYTSLGFFVNGRWWARVRSISVFDGDPGEGGQQILSGIRYTSSSGAQYNVIGAVPEPGTGLLVIGAAAIGWTALRLRLKRAG